MTEEEWKAVEQRRRILLACTGPDSMLSDKECLELAALSELASFREKLDREKVAKVVYDACPNWSTTGWEEMSDEDRWLWFNYADALIRYLEGE
jgi:hypothetical protein